MPKLDLQFGSKEAREMAEEFHQVPDCISTAYNWHTLHKTETCCYRHLHTSTTCI